MNYIILDLEATCWENDRTKQNEIIEIGAVMIGQDLSIKDEFQAFIKPKINPKLSEFCIKLTSINQEDVDNAAEFPAVIKDFNKWITSSGEPYYLCSWGFYDKKQLKKDCELHGVDSSWIGKHISIKHQHGKLIGVEKGVGMGAALKMLNIPLEGVHHRGIDDARNISKIFIKIFNELKFD